jgi:hypothetical protein
VNRHFAIRRLLAVLVIGSLVLAPMAGIVMAATPSDVSMQAMADETPASAATDEMASMPCCPSKAPAPAGCDICVLMAVCMSKCFMGLSATIAHPFAIAANSIALGQNEVRPDGLGHPPPEHPPRTLV